MKFCLPFLLLFHVLSAQPQKISGVPILMGTEASVLPVQWRKEPVKGQAIPADEKACREILDQLKKTLSQYPTHILRENLAGIQLVQNLIFFGKYYPGTYTHNRIWIALENPKKKWTPGFSAEVFHREFSSILLNNYSRYFQQKEWESLLPSGYQYPGTQIFDPDSIDLQADAAWMQYGFMNAWAASSLENDFNAIAAILFGLDSEFWQNTEKYPLLMKKMLLTLAFYRSLDPIFTENYFRSLMKAKSLKQ